MLRNCKFNTFEVIQCTCLIVYCYLCSATLACCLNCITMSVTQDTCSDGGQTIYPFHLSVLFSVGFLFKKKKKTPNFFASLDHSIFSCQLLFFFPPFILFFSFPYNLHLISAEWTTTASECHNQNRKEHKSLLQLQNTGRISLLSLCPSFTNKAMSNLSM